MPSKLLTKKSQIENVTSLMIGFQLYSFDYYMNSINRNQYRF